MDARTVLVDAFEAIPHHRRLYSDEVIPRLLTALAFAGLAVLPDPNADLPPEDGDHP